MQLHPYVARVKFLHPSFPNPREALESSLGEVLRASPELRGDLPILAALRRFAQPHPSKPTPVLWIDWGTAGHKDDPISSDELREWVVFSEKVLARGCPPDMRIVSYLAIQTPTENHGLLVECIEEFKEDYNDASFQCELIPALPKVTRVEIRDYLLFDPPNTLCPKDRAREAAEVIYRETNGAYESVVKWIERAEKRGWNEMLRESKPKAKSPKGGRVTF
jgi:hypothetical protein